MIYYDCFYRENFYKRKFKMAGKNNTNLFTGINQAYSMTDRNNFPDKKRLRKKSAIFFICSLVFTSSLFEIKSFSRLRDL